MWNNWKNYSIFLNIMHFTVYINDTMWYISQCKAPMPHTASILCLPSQKAWLPWLCRQASMTNCWVCPLLQVTEGWQRMDCDVVGRIMLPKDGYSPILWDRLCYLKWQRDPQGCDEPKILDAEVIPDFLSRPNVIIRYLQKEGERVKDAALLTLKPERDNLRECKDLQEMKGPGDRFSPRTSRKTALLMPWVEPTDTFFFFFTPLFISKTVS